MEGENKSDKNGKIDNNNAGKIILGTAAIIRDGDRYLIAQRKKDSKLEANKWEFPGGKVEYLEDPKDTIIREIKEELDIVISPENIFDVVSTIFEKNSERFHVVLIFYECKYISGEISHLDCQDTRWVARENFDDFIYAKADIPVIEKLRRIDLKN